MVRSPTPSDTSEKTLRVSRLSKLFLPSNGVSLFSSSNRKSSNPQSRRSSFRPQRSTTIPEVIVTKHNDAAHTTDIDSEEAEFKLAPEKREDSAPRIADFTPIPHPVEMQVKFEATYDGKPGGTGITSSTATRGNMDEGTNQNKGRAERPEPKRMMSKNHVKNFHDVAREVRALGGNNPDKVGNGREMWEKAVRLEERVMRWKKVPLS